jgi:hypothetical protein
MKNKAKYFLILAVLLLLNSALYGQDDSITYLEKVGTLDSLYSEILGEYRSYYLQLPADYSANSNKKYPVTYILDGEVFLPTVHDVLRYYSGNRMPEMVLVGVANDKNRMRDLTTSKVSEMYGMPFDHENGEAEQFSQFLEKELIPSIEDEYSVTTYRTLIGHSYGGLFVLYSLINQADLYANYIAIDPSLNWDDQKLLKEAHNIFPKVDYTNKSLFISLAGTLLYQQPNMSLEKAKKDSTDLTLFERSNIAFSDMVNENKSNMLDYKWKFYPEDIHGTVPFPSIMDGLLWTFEWYQWEGTDKFSNPTTSADVLREIILNREQKLANHFGYSVPPYPEEVLVISGDMSVDMEQWERAKMFLDFATKYYPNSADAYTTMAKYHEATNNTEEAIKYAKKALAISGATEHQALLKDLMKK